MHILDPSRIHVINTFSTYSNKLFYLCPWTALALSVYDEDACDQSNHSRSENLGPLASRFFANNCGHKSRMLVASDFRHRIKPITRNLAA